MNGRYRNEPCWCGSGKKLKKCHLDRERQAPIPSYESELNFRKLFSVKSCLHPMAGPSCVGNIVRAHTIRKSADLKLIARQGHVYQCTPSSFKDLDRNAGQITPGLVGINKASTFWGFCRKHDAQTFAPLERRDIIPDQEQAFLLLYRPLVKELYLKRSQLETFEMARTVDRGRKFPYQVLIQQTINDLQTGVKAAIREINYYKALLDSDLSSGSYLNIRFVVLELDRVPEVMCSGLHHPVYTFRGEQLQDLSDVRSLKDVLSFSLTAMHSGGAAVFAWRSDCDGVCNRFVDSLLSLGTGDAVVNAMIRFAFSGLENVFFSPDWWEGLPMNDRSSVIERINHGADFRIGVEPDYLTEDGVRTVSWALKGTLDSRM